MFGFRRRVRADDGVANPFEGVVLLDNTTIFGARHAFEWDPPRPGELPSGVDLRSLMDVLEAVVLLDRFAVDASSREYYAWPELGAVSDASGSFFQDTSVLERLGHEFHDVLIASSAEKTSRSLRAGDLVRHLGFLPTARDLDVLPPLYQSTEQFISLTAPAMGKPGGGLTEAAEAGQERLRHLAATLDQYPEPVRNFAFFAFRGFYYQDLAHLVSMSYMPHSWRSELIRGQLDHPRARFSDFVLEEAGKLRRVLRKRIDREFGAATALSTDFPLIASFVIGQSSSRGELLRVAAEVRRNPKVVGFRKWLRDVERSLRDESDLHGVATAQEELRAVVREVERELGLGEKGSQEVTLRFAVPLASVETTSQVSRSRQQWSARLVTSRRPHLVFLRELALESTRLAPFAVAFRRLAP
ncbi:hypothetical protein [Saccharothrix sp. CB00851]|uniref:hypothetical protein n=1 Tax=Saccharothrix sp. CB00851 TaxID=1835005 RepID=UPI00093FDEA7|nr:hypothetical protein [Saccharothrix sp. CB00851]OKI21448.1 hypothetical protein A6A25_09045 [Saccharothrix sp. CB00851]